MANIIRIKRSTTAQTPGTLQQAELAYSEVSNKLFIGVGTGGTGGSATSIVPIGGTGAFFTLDTPQEISNLGVKTFNTTNFKLTGGSSGQFLKTTGSGNVEWADTSVNAYSSILGDQGGTITASGATSLKITGGVAAVTVVVSEGTQDTATINVADAATNAKGIVQLSDAVDSTSNSLAATPKAVKSAYDLADAALPKAGGTMSGFVTLHSDPTSAMHAATKQYVDNVAVGLEVKPSVRAATTGPLPGGAGTYNHGASGGVGATLTGGSNAALGAIDNVTLTVGQRILVKNQANQVHNGIYTVTRLGNGVTEAFILTRATDSDTSAEVTPGMFVFVEEGDRNADNGFVLSTNSTITLGTTNLEFTQFSGAGQITITPGTGLAKDGNTLSITTVPATNGGTGLTTYANGDILYAGSANPTALTKLAAASTGNVLLSGTAPSWGKVALGSAVSGTLPVGNGGTGITSFGTGVATFLGTPSSANLAAAVTDETGFTTGAKLVFSDNPTFTAPILGNATATTVNKVTITQPATSATLTIANGKTLTANNTLTFNGTDSSTVSFGGGGTVAYTSNKISAFASTSSAELAGAISDETGYTAGAVLVFNTSPSFRTSIDASTSEFSVFDGTATKINAFGAAEDISIGATAGATLIRNKVQLRNATASLASINFGTGTANPSSPVNGDFWNNGGTLKFRYGAATKDLILDDSVVDGGTFT